MGAMDDISEKLRLPDSFWVVAFGMQIVALLLAGAGGWYIAGGDTYQTFHDVSENWNRVPYADIVPVPLYSECPAGTVILGPYGSVEYITRVGSRTSTTRTIVGGWKRIKFCGYIDTNNVKPVFRLRPTVNQTTGVATCPAGTKHCGGAGCCSTAGPCPVSSFELRRDNVTGVDERYKFRRGDLNYTVILNRNESRGGLAHLGMNVQVDSAFKGMCLGMVEGSVFKPFCNNPDDRYTQVDNYMPSDSPLYAYYDDVDASGEARSGIRDGYQPFLFQMSEIRWDDTACGMTRYDFSIAINNYSPHFGISVAWMSLIYGFLVLLNDSCGGAAVLCGGCVTLISGAMAFAAGIMDALLTKTLTDVIDAGQACTDYSTLGLATETRLTTRTRAGIGLTIACLVYAPWVLLLILFTTRVLFRVGK